MGQERCSVHAGSVCKLPETHFNTNDWDSLLGMEGQAGLEGVIGPMTPERSQGLTQKSLKSLHANLDLSFLEEHLKP